MRKQMLLPLIILQAAWKNNNPKKNNNEFFPQNPILRSPKVTLLIIDFGKKEGFFLFFF